MKSSRSTALVTGASGLLGRRLVKHLAKKNYLVTAIGRRNCPNVIRSDCHWLNIDIIEPSPLNIHPNVLIHAAPLWLLPGFIEQLSLTNKIDRCIAFSSTSAESKVEAIDVSDRNLADKLLTAEAKIKVLCGNRIPCTIFRPTMIYGYGEDQNISVIARFIKKRGFFPVAGKANGLRQPIHVDDLIEAVDKVVENQKTFGKTYSLTGGETLSYKKMIRRIFAGLNCPSKIIHLPIPIYRLLLTMMNSGYSSGTANRMNQNLSYNSQDAVNDFNYQAQMFLSDPKRDLSEI